MTTFRHRRTDALARAFNRGHKATRRWSRGHIGRTFRGMLLAELGVVGRRSGRPRSVMVTVPVRDDRRAVIVAAKGGDDRHPEWYRNLVVNPYVQVTVDGVTRVMRARTASAAEKAELWPRIVATSAIYDRYRRRTRRDIPIVICETSWATTDPR